MFFFLSFLLVFPVWMRGGTRLELMGPIPWMALGVLVTLLWQPPVRRDETAQAARMRVWHGFFSDPVLYVGLAFLLLLGLQWWNGPREEIYDPTLNRWIFGPPPRPGLALFCVDRQEAREMLFWFGPLYVALLAARNGLGREGKMELLKLLAMNAGLAACFGLIQYFSKTDLIYWLVPAKAPFFAAFGYQNHAGSFFVLMTALLLGFLVRSLVRGEEKEELPWLLPVLILTSFGAIFSRSRAAILLMILLASAGGLYGFKRVRWRYSVQSRTAVLVCLAAFLGVAAYVAAVVPGNPVRVEMRGALPEEQKSAGLTEELADRLTGASNPFRPATWNMVNEHLWFGVGGWGYRHYLPHYVEAETTAVFPVGSGNAHNDPLQFLVEFGMFGAGLLALTLGLAVWPALRRLREIRKPEAWDTRSWLMKIPPLGLALLVGPLLILAQGFVDLPFRSPAILWTWFLMLACAGEFLDRHAERHRRRHGGVAAASSGQGERPV